MSEKIVHALKFKILDGIYDHVVRITCRDNTIKNSLISIAQIKGACKVLDVGCGTGTLLLKIKDRYENCDIVGVDADKRILEIAKLKADKKNINIRLFDAYAQELPFDENTFDVVVSSLLFHHLNNEDKTKAFKEIHRILKKDGKLILADWDKPQNPLLKFGFFMLRLLDGFNNTELHLKGELIKLIKQEGFKNVIVDKKINTVFGTISIWSAQK